MSKLEDMLAKVLQKVESTDAGVKEMKDSHTTSIKQIEQQLEQLSASLNQRKNGLLLSDTIQNPKKDGHCMAIATRSIRFLMTQFKQVLNMSRCWRKMEERRMKLNK
ncbi:hypothetical protein R3W88_026728 [Solanum pinnatisectum]|uniref:Uncharacterized protein n=1 Tax=Solanum pinnatisectum TaxID=50273 RepID=A0AAV9LGQ7_9SOLN|nr:hypothetical protein R3W88_026728 [Solanum pinnatisectum]